MEEFRFPEADDIFVFVIWRLGEVELALRIDRVTSIVLGCKSSVWLVRGRGSVVETCGAWLGNRSSILTLGNTKARNIEHRLPCFGCAYFARFLWFSIYPEPKIASMALRNACTFRMAMPVGNVLFRNTCQNKLT